MLLRNVLYSTVLNMLVTGSIEYARMNLNTKRKTRDVCHQRKDERMRGENMGERNCTSISCFRVVRDRFGGESSHKSNAPEMSQYNTNIITLAVGRIVVYASAKISSGK